MTRVLKTSGFLGLTVMMVVGLYQSYLLSSGGGVPSWMIGGHAHLGVLSILAIVVGLAIPAMGISGRLERAISGMFVVGQWGVPLTPWLAVGAGIELFHPAVFLWGGLLVLSMLLMTWQAAIQPAPATSGPEAVPTDD